MSAVCRVNSLCCWVVCVRLTVPPWSAHVGTLCRLKFAFLDGKSLVILLRRIVSPDAPLLFSLCATSRALVCSLVTCFLCSHHGGEGILPSSSHGGRVNELRVNATSGTVSCFLFLKPCLNLRSPTEFAATTGKRLTVMYFIWLRNTWSRLPTATCSP